MAKLRSATAYKKIKRPYTRISKFRKKAYIKGIPSSRVVMFDMGNLSKKFANEVTLIAKAERNIRHNAIEAARVAANKQLVSNLGKQGFAMKIRAVPHNIIREHKLATGAGADRLSSGMAHSYGKAVSRSCHVRVGKPLITIYVDDNGVKTAREALRKAASKFPISCRIEVKKID